ncbi:lyase family protein [Paenibacillus sp.]|jgi:aspartate ammonia-lyase|uniref:lyase family protein n=1 Tax=Paenibacillus sp. TaxID=58172 RepID=UPI002819E8D5|nr:lyase family protein [Paenibacillus sp.]MDR0270508.1 hypothetical protein [Paenibacillus sp.]
MIRIEHDILGARVLPAHAYYGIQTLRTIENYPRAAAPVHTELVMAMASIKKAAAQAHLDLGTLPERIGNLIVKAADEVMTGKHRGDFIVDFFQDVKSEPLNMNMNEVLANRALEFMLEDKGNYSLIDPTRHVDLAQNADGVISTALRIAAHRLSQTLIRSIDQLIGYLITECKQADRPAKPENPQLGTPEWLGRHYVDSARCLQDDLKRLITASSLLQADNLGAEHIVRLPNTSAGFTAKIGTYLREITQISDYGFNDGINTVKSCDTFLQLSSALKHCTMNLSKLCSDIRVAVLQQSVPNKPNLNANPVLKASESLQQITFQVIGLNHSLYLAAEAGMVDRNVVPPLIVHNLIESLKILNIGIETFTLAITKETETVYQLPII